MTLSRKRHFTAIGKVEKVYNPSTGCTKSVKVA